MVKHITIPDGKLVMFLHRNISPKNSEVHQFEVFSVNTPIQYALAEFMQDPNEYLHVHTFMKTKGIYLITY